jgi:hypothetical protein
MTVLILQEALDELEAAVRWYRAITAELGAGMRHEFEGRVAWLSENPKILRLRTGWISAGKSHKISLLYSIHHPR